MRSMGIAFTKLFNSKRVAKSVGLPAENIPQFEESLQPLLPFANSTVQL